MSIHKWAAGAAGTVLLLGFGTGIAQAKHGADDPAGHHRHSAGDRAGHDRRDDHGRHHGRHHHRGADDGARHDARDDHGHRHGGHGADD